MPSGGFSHIGLATHDLAKTLDFYENVLGFKTVRYDIMEIAEGGQIHHAALDDGHGGRLAFMEPREVPGIPDDFDTGINAGLGVPDGFYHIAMEVADEEELEQKRQHLIANGLEPSKFVDHDFAQSIYFRDPNGLLLEYSYFSRELNEDEAEPKVRLPFPIPLAVLNI